MWKTMASRGPQGAMRQPGYTSWYHIPSDGICWEIMWHHYLQVEWLEWRMGIIFSWNQDLVRVERLKVWCHMGIITELADGSSMAWLPAALDPGNVQTTTKRKRTNLGMIAETKRIILFRFFQIEGRKAFPRLRDSLRLFRWSFLRHPWQHSVHIVCWCMSINDTAMIKKRPPKPVSLVPGHSTPMRWVHFETLWAWSMMSMLNCTGVRTAVDLHTKTGTKSRLNAPFHSGTGAIGNGWESSVKALRVSARRFSGRQTLPAWYWTLVKKAREPVEDKSKCCFTASNLNIVAPCCSPFADNASAILYWV